MIYPMAPAELVFEFFETKGIVFHREGASSFPVSDDNASPVVSVDTEAEMIDLNLLVEDFTIAGSRYLAEELIQWLGANPNY